MKLALLSLASLLAAAPAFSAAPAAVAQDELAEAQLAVGGARFAARAALETIAKVPASVSGILVTLSYGSGGFDRLPNDGKAALEPYLANKAKWWVVYAKALRAEMDRLSPDADGLKGAPPEELAERAARAARLSRLALAAEAIAADAAVDLAAVQALPSNGTDVSLSSPELVARKTALYQRLAAL